MFTSEERGTTALQPINACNLMLRDDDEMVCGICSRSHMFGLQRKFNILEVRFGTLSSVSTPSFYHYSSQFCAEFNSNLHRVAWRIKQRHC